MKIIHYLVIVCLVLLSCARPSEMPGSRSGNPNILIIMADDMGFSDLGSYGGEISTPHIDRLAANGIRYTSFYNAGRCCPTRASLLTGLYPHQAGMGWMTAADLGTEGYTGEINNQCVTIGEVLGKSGYSTYMVGKWHVTADKNMGPEGPGDSWPLQRGFDRYYGPHNGGGSYFTTSGLTYGNERIQPSGDFYLTDALSDTAASFIRKHEPGRPFFMYLAYTAPHFPLHAKSEDIAKYTGKYRDGWDSLRSKRYQHMLELGLADASWVLTPPMPDVREWKNLDEAEQREFDRRMAVYAAQIDNMDRGIGRVMDALEDKGFLDHTVVMFLSDNGGTSEFISRGIRDPANIGSDESYESYRKPWATMSNTPFRFFKQWVHEGGISTPLIVHWPAGIKDKGLFRHQVGHVIDLLPTCLELAGGEYPEKYQGNPILPREGISLVHSFNSDETEERLLFWEHQATRAVRMGDWKLVANSTPDVKPYTGPWELYHIKSDRAESDDLSLRYPEKVREMDSIWNRWAIRCNVYPLDGRGWFERLEKGNQL